MCRYCNYDVPLHYLINDAPLLNKTLSKSRTFRETSLPNRKFISKAGTLLDQGSGIYSGAPEFNEGSWDFADNKARQLYKQIGVVDRTFDFAIAENVFQDADEGDVLTYSTILADNNPLPDWLHIDSDTARFRGVPDTVSNFEIELIATDTDGASASIKFDLEILASSENSSGNPGGIERNLQLWLRGDAGVIETEGKLAAWLDQSSNNFYAAQGIDSYQPTINHDGLNGKPTLSFDPDTVLNRELLGDNLDVAFDSKLNPEEFTVFVVNSVAEGLGDSQSLLSSRNESNSTGYSFFASEDNLNYQLQTGTASDGNSLSSNTTITDNQWEILTGSANATSSQLQLNGKEVANSTTNYVPNLNESLRIGGSGNSYYGENPFQGEIAEILVFDTVLGESDRDRVESYLAVKYGLSLDQTTPTNYLDSNGAVWWDAVKAGDYKYNIAGLARDDGSNLSQTISSSSNLDGIVSVQLEDLDQLANRESLFWSDNGTDASANSISYDVPPDYAGRLNRAWRVAETGEVGDLTLSFDLSGRNYSLANPQQFSLLIDDDSTFNDASVHTTGRKIAGQTISFSNLNLNTGDYFTLATTDVINHNPTARDNLITTEEDASYTFAAQDFGFEDRDEGDSLVKVSITRLPKHGTLTLDGVAIRENQSIELANIPYLTFTPDANQFGEEYTNFEFKVNDGEVYSLDSNQMAIAVEPVIDPEEIFSIDKSDVDDGTVVDLMVVYTQGALDQAGSEEVFRSEIEQEIAHLNEALVRSGVNFTVNIVYYGLVEDYVGVDNKTDLDRLNNPHDGYLNRVHHWRNQYSADFVSLITTGSGTGVGYQPGAFNAQSYNVRYNLDHELGHNFGAYHDVYNGGNASTGVAGYRSLEERIATVMSYGQGGATWTRTFSNPDLIINDVAFGSESANNVAQLNSRAMINANLRHSNDNLARAAEITGSDFTIQALNKNATTEAEEPDIANVSSSRSVWWTWTATSDDPVEINTIDSDFDTLLGVYQGTDYSDLQLVAYNDDASNNTSKVTFTPVAGENYKITVAGKDDGKGQIQLNLNTLATLSSNQVVNKSDRSQPLDKKPSLELAEVHRFFQPEAGYHFYTADDRESSEIQESSSTAELKYNYEGTSFAALGSNLDSLTGEIIEEAKPVYRFLNQSTGAHLYTINVEEQEYITENLANYISEGTAYYAFENEPAAIETIPLYRLLNHDNGTHLFTSDRQELDYIQENFSNFSLEGNDGIAFHVVEL